MRCKKCDDEKCRKNGFVRGVQRYKCSECGLNFIEGDRRQKPETAIKKALCVILYSLGKASYNMLGKILGHSPSIIYRWIKKAMETTQEPHIHRTFKKLSLMRCGIFPQKKPKTLDHQSSGSWLKENCCLGYRGSLL